MTLDDKVTLASCRVVERSEDLAPDEKQMMLDTTSSLNLVSRTPKPGKYIVYSDKRDVIGIQIAEKYEETIVFTNYKRSSTPGLVWRDGTMFKDKKYVKLSSLKPDYGLIFKLGTLINVGLARRWNPEGFLKDYTLVDSFFK